MLSAVGAKVIATASTDEKLELAKSHGAGWTIKSSDDLVSKDGRLQVEVSALDGGQYLGMAPADLFIRTPDRPFASGFFKAVFGIWLMTALVVVRWGQTELPPQAGVAVYVRGDGGKLAAARIYDDVDPPL